MEEALVPQDLNGFRAGPRRCSKLLDASWIIIWRLMDITYNMNINGYHMDFLDYRWILYRKSINPTHYIPLYPTIWKYHMKI